jgi:hypothetical protein
LIAPPPFTVVIATYNWSSALALALRSVQAQTFTDFEVLVVGDGCTDDSEQVVAAMKDPRFQWHNLPVNQGSQWAPNNHGLALARGRLIAYLGHDDLWWPTHLANAHACLADETVDMVAAATLMSGPESSGMRALSGFFPNGIHSPRHFFVPSSTVHRLELGRRVGGWRPPEEALVAVDVDFVRRCHEAGARIVSTEDFTTFKFNAAWRRDAYRTKDPAQQREFLARMQGEGEAFRLRALTTALKAASQDRLITLHVPWGASDPALQSATVNHDFKGSRKGSPPTPERRENGRRRYSPTQAYAGFEWHGLEHDAAHGPFRWTGPSTHADIVLPEPLDQPLEVRLQLLHAIRQDVLDSLSVEVNGVPTAHTLQTEANAGHPHLAVRLAIDPGQLPALDRAELRLSLVVAHTWRPSDLGPSSDARWLGLAIGWTEVGPLPPTPLHSQEAHP